MIDHFARLYLWHMKQPLAEVMQAHADKLEARSNLPKDKDHAKWLKSAAKGLRKRAAAKAKAFAHKQHQKKRKTEQLD
jgi:hypothetical protein